MPATVRSLDERVDDLAEKVEAVTNQLTGSNRDFAAFQSRMDTLLKFIQWIGVFFAGVMVTVVIGVIQISFSAGKVDATVQQLQQANGRLEASLEKQQNDAKTIASELSGLRGELSQQSLRLAKIEGELIDLTKKLNTPK